MEFAHDGVKLLVAVSLAKIPVAGNLGITQIFQKLFVELIDLVIG
jgi:hypothetical protein